MLTVLVGGQICIGHLYVCGNHANSHRNNLIANVMCNTTHNLCPVHREFLMDKINTGTGELTGIRNEISINRKNKIH